MSYQDQDAFIALRSIVAERTRPLLVWTGSGLSLAAGLPSWQGLKDELVAAASRSAATYSATEATTLADRIDRIRRSPDFWLSFKLLRGILGETSYTAIIREQLSAADSTPAPENYRALWKLRLQGMMTLNLDRFAAKAYAAEHPDLLPLEYAGREIAQMRGAMFGGRPFIGNLHGVVDKTDSWVFTIDDLSNLVKNQDYTDFLKSCLSFLTNIFVGISVDDIAIGSHLDALAPIARGNAPSFWITHRQDVAVGQWAESRGIRVIRYRAIDGDHSELAAMLRELATHVAADVSGLPPVSELGEVSSLLEPGPEAVSPDAYGMSTVELRKHLNGVAAKILGPGDEAAYRSYQKFSDENDELIYRAWYATARPGNNDLLGYELKEEVARGAFGRVYRAIAPGGDDVAVKILLDEVRRAPAALESFRRGVRSMQILDSSQIAGMVRYRAASEIPAFVAMDWIEGPNLEDAKAARELERIEDVLTVALEMARVIRRAHMLPERILHRDIRPANVMLRDYWTARDFSDVVVLDFDLSWHVGAAERSVVFSTASGYLAPEQQSRRPKESTRSALVDSFGLGMSLYFLVSGQHPLPNEQIDAAWPERVRSAVSALLGGESWRSVVYRVTRIVVGSTVDSQAARWDVSRIESELGLAVAAVSSGASTDVNVLAEELAARCPAMERYTWDEDQQRAVVDSPTGLHVTLAGDPVGREIELSLSWAQTGVEDRTGLARSVRERLTSVASRLGAKWKVQESSANAGSFSLTARASVQDVARAIDAFADNLHGALSKAAYR